MNRSVVLIVSRDPVAAALIGASIELSGLDPKFPAADESGADALRRVRPAALLLEYDPKRHRESIAGPALMQGVRVALFAPHARVKRLATIARRLGVPCFTLPIEHAALAHIAHELAFDDAAD